MPGAIQYTQTNRGDIMPDQLLFLKSPRFWQLGVAAIAEFLGSQGIIPVALAHALAAWMAGSVTIRTVDRNVDAANQ